jgi:hypothetical protein
MKVPAIHGFIERRMLINYTAEPEVIATILPPPFKPKIYKGKAIAGICLIRLKSIKPKGFPDFLGVNSENGAHRIAVEWEENGSVREGVYIPRRDTSLRLNSLIGGRLFPGKQYLARFHVGEGDGRYHLDFTSSDRTYLEVDARRTERLNANSIFASVQEASLFFQNGSVGYSPKGKHFEGLKLQTYQWKVSPLTVEKVRSSFFEDKRIFPEGTVRFDHGLLMEDIEHEWRSLKTITGCY